MTFQGEGQHAGRACVFLRLSGCNLACAWCDTPYTWDWKRYNPRDEITKLPVSDVLARLRVLDTAGVRHVVVTGGEPLLQLRALSPLLSTLLGEGWMVEVETNGTVLPGNIPLGVSGAVWWNVSPKLAHSGDTEEDRLYPHVLREFALYPRAVFKFVCRTPEDVDEAERIGDAAGVPSGRVWILPEGVDPVTLSERARALAPAVLERGFNLSWRLHTGLWGDERGR